MTEMHTTSSIVDKRREFRKLHESGCFVIPNPWDAGSARYLQTLGFKALATTSSGFAWAHARADNAVSRDDVLAHLHTMVTATDLPVNADFESGFGSDAAGVAQSVTLAVASGIAGLSIEDSTGDAAHPLFDKDTAVQRLCAARRAIDTTGADVMLVARSEGFVAGRPDLEATIDRLRAYSNVGADCLYAPGITSEQQIRAVVTALHPKPVNVLVSGPSEFSVDQLAALGVRRISVGGAFARAAWGGFMQAAQTLAAQGSFACLAGAPSHGALDALFPRV